MSNIIHPAQSVAQKIVIDSETQALLVQACHDHDVAKESMGTVAGRFYNIGIRAAHLKQSGGDKEIINIVDNAIAATMPEMARVLFSKKNADLNQTDRAIRTAFIKNLADKRTALAKALKTCEENEAADGNPPADLADVLADALKAILERVQKGSVVNAKTGESKLDNVNVVDLVNHLQNAIAELT